MTIVVTRNVPDRFRGFLASCMLELAPGAYTNPLMTSGIRDRVWTVCCEWADAIPDDGGVLMTWQDQDSPGRQAVLMLGWPKKELTELNGVWLDRRPSESGTAESGSVTTE